MGIKVKSTKVFRNLPCGHAQFFDKEPDGSPGQCASVHGYDRAVEIRFAGEPDEMGWIVAFGDATKPIKRFLEYYFDHVTVLPANDPRLTDIPDELTVPGQVLGTLRVLPSGVSMEMSSVFIWEHVNAYVYKITDGRCYVEQVRVYEHERNDAMCEVDESTAKQQGANYTGTMLPEKPRWAWESPQDLLERLNG
jgi:6-pyruvoyl-tetrahydropterin synthase